MFESHISLLLLLWRKQTRVFAKMSNFYFTVSLFISPLREFLSAWYCCKSKEICKNKKQVYCSIKSRYSLCHKLVHCGQSIRKYCFPLISDQTLFFASFMSGFPFPCKDRVVLHFSNEITKTKWLHSSRVMYRCNKITDMKVVTFRCTAFGE